jgi:hypothetical protein
MDKRSEVFTSRLALGVLLLVASGRSHLDHADFFPHLYSCRPGSHPSFGRGFCAVCRHQTATSDNQKRNRSCLVEALSHHHGFVPRMLWRFIAHHQQTCSGSGELGGHQQHRSGLSPAYSWPWSVWNQLDRATHCNEHTREEIALKR